MDSDKDDLAVLCATLTKDEVDRVHRLLHEWGTGPADSFPVQFVLLTRAQLRAAASVPRAIADSRKWLEQHFAEYRRQTQVMLDDSSRTGDRQTAALKSAVEDQAKAVQQAAEQIQAQLDDAEAVAKRVKSLMDSAASEWRGIRAETKVQYERLQQVSNDLQNRFAWQVIIWWAVSILLAFGLGFSFAVNKFH